MVLTKLDTTFPCAALSERKVPSSFPSEQSTDYLIRLLLEKSEKGFTLLYNNYADALFNIILQVVKRKEIAEDLLQEVFIKIWMKIADFDEARGTLYTWMLNIARNAGIDYIRLRNNRFHRKLFNDDNLEDGYSQPNACFEIADRLDYLAIKNKAANLENKYAVVIDLIYFQGCTYDQVSLILNLPLGTVKTRGRMALTLLKRMV